MTPTNAYPSNWGTRVPQSDKTTISAAMYAARQLGVLPAAYYTLSGHYLRSWEAVFRNLEALRRDWEHYFRANARERVEGTPFEDFLAAWIAAYHEQENDA